jgi:hypothetical protein
MLARWAAAVGRTDAATVEELARTDEERRKWALAWVGVWTIDNRVDLAGSTVETYTREMSAELRRLNDF